MALHNSVFICGVQFRFNYNAGNGRATSLEISGPTPVTFRVVLSNGSEFVQTLAPGSYSFPLPNNLVRITFDANGEATITGLVSLEAAA